MNQLKLLSMTVVLTLLIWISADQLQIVDTTIPVTLEFAPMLSESRMQVIVLDREPFKVHVSGPRRAVTQIEESAPLTVTIKLPDRPTNPRDRIDSLVDLLRSERGALGDLQIEAVDPPAARVRVDRQVEVDADLVVLKPLRFSYEQPPRLDPPRIRVRMWESIRGPDTGRTWTLPIDVEQRLGDLAPGAAFDFTLPIPLTPFGSDARVVGGGTVRITGRLSPQTLARRTIRAVSIKPVVTFANLARRIRIELISGGNVLTQTIEVQGTPEDLAVLDEPDVAVYGVVNLRQEDLEATGRELEITPEFLLPPGATLASPPQKVKLRIVAVDD